MSGLDVRACQALDFCLRKLRELKRAKDRFHNIGLKRTAWLICVSRNSYQF